MKNLIETLEQNKGVQFVSVLYRAKSSGELSRRVINVGASYTKALEKDLTELNILKRDAKGLELKAIESLIESVEKSLEHHSKGQVNPDYTKKGIYREISKGIKINLNDNSLELWGFQQSKVILEQGIFPKVNSRPLTIAKRKIEKNLRKGKFRTLALDLGNVQLVRSNGKCLVFGEKKEVTQGPIASLAQVGCEEKQAMPI